ncbi:helix-turn-helix domain-containing protein [Companilactobacillus furfuricola]|uniref:helix-turn-helix domain-containing protein n=1 Tax=Companilactobacillus furfuricola TaxID=1462575 RepID=UPI000F79644B|nr:helix-turn-helix domain-containing protein [Companilactobacillus furfuricola]
MKYTTEQQQEIAQYAIDHERDFKATGKKYDISYQQVAAWVRIYDPSAQKTKDPTKKKSVKSAKKSQKSSVKRPSKVDDEPTETEEKTSTLDVLSRRDPVLEKQLEDVKRRLGLIK